MSERHADVLIVGAGQAGLECAAALRMAKFAGTIEIVGRERHLPYSRPPLSKDYLLGKSTEENLLLRPPAFFESNGIALELGREIVSIDPGAHEAVLDDGSVRRYGSLVLATGGRPRRLGRDDVDAAPNVHYIRTIADIDRLRPDIRGDARMVVIGGGYIGLETASVARRSGMHVTIVEMAPRLLARVAGPELSDFFLRLHRAEGVEVRLDTRIDDVELDGDGRVVAVHVEGGGRIDADVLVVGIGLVPETEIAETAGLRVDNGVVVDALCRTSAADVFAIGDISRQPDPQSDGTRRLESVPNAAEQARTVAGVIVGSPRPNDAIPWFWSDQYEHKLQSVGLWTHHDRVVVRGGGPGDEHITVLYLQGDRLCAADVVGSPRDFVAAKRLVAARQAVDEDLLRDPAVAIKDAIVESPESAQPRRA
ncbi:NAD(P)/FAD-dependent oxidoreductase [Microbacterium sp. No. 7]|uniref:NAD(P)/FAD-dependent oxidoreductase n=1 Tax=Microbacterium sp. No. 7 TaxID=1714373 RepID=UPI0006D0FE31|nr:FAD-dependent oxidoreductase [Microbacterium sp. No. 7]ALJ18849.1 hypothetical protein AOA12_02550 [Microbacterium sp. No. 7]